MSGVLSISPDDEFVYRVDILQVFTRDERSYNERINSPKFVRERLDEPKLIEVGFYGSAKAARNYGSYRTDRASWYNTLNAKATWQKIDGEWQKVDPYKPSEPTLDYRVYKVPIKLDMGEATLLPALKKLSE